MTDCLIRLRGVSKAFPVSGSRLARRAKSWRTVLHGIDLELHKGESLAVLGENGAGKSTLLKIIAGVARATAGEVAVQGTFGALIELGAGFHPEQTGLENLKAGATLMGVPRDEIGEITEQAMAFSGLRDHADKPLKHYSSGMVVRLGFAMIASIRPDLLISDEVLAVGDESFQKKCIGWLESYLAGGGTLLLVSHNLYHVQKLCERAVWLHEGTIRSAGDTFEVVQEYLAFHEARLGRASTAANDAGLPGLAFAPEGRTSYSQGETVALTLDGSPEAPLTCALRRLSGDLIWERSLPVEAAECELPTADLLPGRYVVEISRPGAAGGVTRLFRITGASREFGSLRLPHSWVQ
ncbi:MAG: ATP-binding cassette domain-containing protein [Xanthomonadales bacterium]|nr:ATP-binding cassette domain-containing protein [Xanthomonadales bacterium]